MSNPRLKRYGSALVFASLLVCICNISGCAERTSGSTPDILGGTIQGVPLKLKGNVTTVAGVKSGSGSADGVGAAARFYNPSGITRNGDSLYVADTDNQTVRKIDVTTGLVTTFAGMQGVKGASDGIGVYAQFNTPSGIATDGTSLFVTDAGSYTIRKINIATGAVTTLAGTAGAFGSADGTGANAQFYSPEGITTDGTNLYVADEGNYTIRKIVIATAEVTTLAGTAGMYGDKDGTGTDALFGFPAGITTDGTNLYVADENNEKIRKLVISTREVTTFAGSGSYGSLDGGSGIAQFASPRGIVTDGANLYVTDNPDGHGTIRKIVISTGDVTTLAGSVILRGSSDGVGAAARFTTLNGISTDGHSLYVTDTDDQTIRKIEVATGVVTTVAGNAPGYQDGASTSAYFNNPIGITCDGTNLYVADTANHVIRQIEIATGLVSTIAGTAGLEGEADGIGTAAQFDFPTGITTDGRNLYVADTANDKVRKIDISTHEVTTIAGTGAAGSNDGIGIAAKFFHPFGITTDGTSLYLTDASNNTIRKIDIATGMVTTIAGTGGPSGSLDGVGSAAQFNYPAGITTNGTHLYVADKVNNTVRAIDIASHNVTTLAGMAGSYGSNDGAGSAAEFIFPIGITTDGTSLYVTDTYNHTVRKIDIKTHAVTTLAGIVGTRGANDGVGSAATFHSPSGITSDGINLYLTDTENGVIRKIQ